MAKVMDATRWRGGDVSWPARRPLLALAAIGLGSFPAAAQTPAPRFAVFEFRVEGNTVLPAIAVEEAVYPHLGTGRTAADIEMARAALEEAYQKAGYPTVSVELPQQRVHDGIVRFKVVERTVGRLRVAGAQYFLPSQVRAGAPSLAEGRVPNLPAVQRDIVALNRLPDRRVTPELKPGQAPNTVDVDLQVEDRLPLHATLELNNRQSSGTRPLRVAGSARYDNLWQRGHSISFAFQTAPQDPDNSTIISGSYLARLPGASGASLLASVVSSNSNVGALGGTTVVGDGTIVGLRGILPLGAEAAFVHSLSAGMDYKNFNENLALGADTTAVPVTYYPVSGAWLAAWNQENATTDLAATLTAGIRGLGSGSIDFEQKRAFATPSWMHWRLDGARLQRLPADIQLWVSLKSQLSGDPLISNEQFPGGGVDSVRGYFEVEALGDYGFTTQTELRSPSLARWLGPHVDELRAHLFFDGGLLGINRALPQQEQSVTLMSAGVGARMRAFGRVNGAIDGAFVLREGPLTRSGAVRALFRLWGEF